jgi:hypothetical protein
MKNGTAAVLEREKDSEGCFFLFRNGEEDGPFSLRELKDLQQAGDISPATPCRSRRAREWHDLAFMVKAAAHEEKPGTIAEHPTEGAASGQAQEPSLKEILNELVTASQRQNRLLSAIRWSLLVLILMTAGVILALQ